MSAHDPKPSIEVLDRPDVKRKAWAAMPLATRFAQFDDLGHCLKKESVKCVVLREQIITL